MSKTATIHVIRHFPTTGTLLMGEGAAALLKDSHQSNADSVYLTGRPTVRNRMPYLHQRVPSYLHRVGFCASIWMQR